MYGKEVKKSLSRMFMSPITGINYRCLEAIGKKASTSRGLMAKDDDISMKCFNIACCVEKRFSFFNARGRSTYCHHISSKTFSSEFKGDSCARARFNKKIGYRFAFE